MLQAHSVKVRRSSIKLLQLPKRRWGYGLEADSPYSEKESGSEEEEHRCKEKGDREASRRQKEASFSPPEEALTFVTQVRLLAPPYESFFRLPSRAPKRVRSCLRCCSASSTAFSLPMLCLMTRFTRWEHGYRYHFGAGVARPEMKQNLAPRIPIRKRIESLGILNIIPGGSFSPSSL